MNNLTFTLSNKLNEEMIKIRYDVFTSEQGFAPEVDIDEKDDCSIHVLAFKDKKAIATARMFKEDNDTYHIGRLAVLKEYRGQGIGSYVLKILEEKAKELNAKKVRLGAQIDKAIFYEKNGYSRVGEIYLDADYPHIMMEKKI